MSQFEIVNATPFEFEPLIVADEQGRGLVVPLLKTTFDVPRPGVVEVSEEQLAVCLAGEPNESSGEGSYRQEPETAFCKPACDVVLVGHATPREHGATTMEVRLETSSIQKSIQVHGDRRWQSGLLGLRPSPPAPLERVPLTWERAFGGWDRTHDDPAKHRCEERNPVGVGYRPSRNFEEGELLPNLEGPGRKSPAGFGFVGPNWEPRRRFAGTYDATWQEERAPLLPEDFDRRFFNAAPTDQVLERVENGQSVRVAGCRAEGDWCFDLPGPIEPEVLVATHSGPDRSLDLKLDTIFLDADTARVTMLFRAHAPLPQGVHDLQTLRVQCSLQNLPLTTASVLAERN